ncbi:transcription factor S-II, central domain-containing protein [Talaromyces proteolyticus]|uniref:Transcription factor BYE1 n=1 Tax=Talaromyces proteolyticus TaxID=1131652 RepID=A0AAD4Q616_9EURO|nr:transcription factor S-II, central domain-containing protein [Talaromyces proteolyticus]KAH8704907.1 transcription factor S-II, central domain-containing protein [Talaromyces proteolyticus]
MADEPRRSGRATKGQHKNLELVQDVPSKKSRKTQPRDRNSKQSAEPTPGPSDEEEEEEEEELIRCICGEYEEEEDIERDMICCDRCSAWQHNDCMGLTFAKGSEPEEYYCEQCKPEDHKDLLEKMARGEKPWEEAARRRQQEIEEKKAAKRKKGKKGKKGGSRPSDVKSQASGPSTPAPAQASPPPATEDPAASGTLQTPAEDNKSPVLPTTPATTDSKPSNTQKRKFEELKEPSTPDLGPKQKQQRISEPKANEKARKASPTQSRKTGSVEPVSRKASIAERSDIVEKPDDIQSDARKKAASHLITVFEDQITGAQKDGTYALPADRQAEDVARNLGLSVEHAMYTHLCNGSGEPNEAYKSQLRTIVFNVKKNPGLRDRLLTGSLAPTALATMRAQDMASEEQQQKDAEIKREAEKQHIIMQEQGPRIRRTHKGEEVIEGDGQAGTSESIFSSTSVHRAAAEADNTATPQSPSGPGRTVANSQQPQEPGVAEKNRKVPTEKLGEMNGDAARSHSPGATNHDNIFPEVPAHLHQPPPTGDKVQADEDIDKLLKDEGTESPPYSPKDFQSSDVWRGTISMNPVAAFASTARHVAGADLSGNIPWSQLVPTTLVVDGRIAVEPASKYLCGLRFSNSTDVSVIAIAPPIPANERSEFDKLFNYFMHRNRYGVVGKHPISAVKDTYIIPIEAGANKQPEFLQLLENNSIEDPLPDQMFLVVFVVKTNDHSSSEQPTPHNGSQDKDHPMVVASPLNSTPLVQYHEQYASPTPATRQGSQITPPLPITGSDPSLSITEPPHSFPQPGHNAAYNNPQQQSQVTPPPQQAHPVPPLFGAAAAAHVLGPHAKSPAIEELLQKAPSADVAQLNIVREIITKNPSAANDYPSLMSAIQQYTSSSQNGQLGPQP